MKKDDIASILSNTILSFFSKKERKKNFKMLLEISFKQAEDSRENNINRINRETQNFRENFVAEIEKTAKQVTVEKLGIEKSNVFLREYGQAFLNLCYYYISERLRNISRFPAKVFYREEKNLKKNIMNIYNILQTHIDSDRSKKIDDVPDDDQNPVSAGNVSTLKVIREAHFYLLELYKKLLESTISREKVEHVFSTEITVQYLTDQGEYKNIPLGNAMIETNAMQAVYAKKREIFEEISRRLPFGIADLLNEQEKIFWEVNRPSPQLTPRISQPRRPQTFESNPQPNPRISQSRKPQTFEPTRVQKTPESTRVQKTPEPTRVQKTPEPTRVQKTPGNR